WRPIAGDWHGLSMRQSRLKSRVELECLALVDWCCWSFLVVLVVSGRWFFWIVLWCRRNAAEVFSACAKLGTACFSEWNYRLVLATDLNMAYGHTVASHMAAARTTDFYVSWYKNVAVVNGVGQLGMVGYRGHL
ncbi:hypothetical protein Ancab_006673, partial [Ancistrocladus abbreviatus]